MRRSSVFVRCICVVALLALVTCGCSGPEDSKPALPVEFFYRPALLGSGYVWVFKSKASEDLTVWVKFTRGWSTLKEGELTIPAHGEREIGWLEGVALRQGDICEVSHSKYKTYQGCVPKSFDF